MTLIKEIWHVYEDGSFRVATEGEIARHLNNIVVGNRA